MALTDFPQSMIPAMFFVIAMLIIFAPGKNSESDLLSIWSNDTYSVPGQIGLTDINSDLSGTAFATPTSTGLVEDNNPFLNLISKLNIVPKIVFTFEAIGGAFADAFSFLPEEIRWGIGLPILAIMTIGLFFFLLNAGSASRGGST